MKDYQTKFIFLAAWCCTAGKGYCPIALDKEDKIVMATELHHTALHNTKKNREMFPHLIDSVFNLTPVSHAAHMKYPQWGKARDIEILELMVAFESACEMDILLRNRVNLVDGHTPDIEMLLKVRKKFYPTSY